MSAEFTACVHDETGQSANIATQALDAWQMLGWRPVGDSRTVAGALADEVTAENAAGHLAVEVPDLTVPEVLEQVGDDPEKAAAALEAELAADKPRTTLVAGLTQKAGQPGDPEGT